MPNLLNTWFVNDCMVSLDARRYSCLIQWKFYHHLICSVSGIWEQDYVSQDCRSLHAQTPLLVCFTCIYFNSAYVIQALATRSTKIVFTGQLHVYFSNRIPHPSFLVIFLTQSTKEVYRVGSSGPRWIWNLNRATIMMQTLCFTPNCSCHETLITSV